MHEHSHIKGSLLWILTYIQVLTIYVVGYTLYDSIVWKVHLPPQPHLQIRDLGNAVSQNLRLWFPDRILNSRRKIESLVEKGAESPHNPKRITLSSSITFILEHHSDRCLPRFACEGSSDVQSNTEVAATMLKRTSSGKMKNMLPQ